jgi:hypothetical protein
MVDHGQVVGNSTRAVIISNRRITGLTTGVIAEIASPPTPAQPSTPHPYRQNARHRALYNNTLWIWAHSGENERYVL